MMNELEWFVSLLDKQDLIKIAQVTQLTITGFRNPSSAPLQRLQDVIRNALRNKYNKVDGKQRRRGLASPSLDLKDFYRETGQKLIQLYPEYEHKNFFELILLLEGEARLKKYEKLAIFYTKFESSYNEYLPRMIENTKNGNGLFHGFINVQGVTRVESVLQVHFKEDLFNKYESSFEEWVRSYFQAEQDKLIKEIVKNQSDDEFAIYIAGLNSMEKFVASFRFLQNNKAYQNKEYQNIVYYLILFYEIHRNTTLHNNLDQFQNKVEFLHQTKKDMEKLLNRTKNEYEHLQHLIQSSESKMGQMKEEIGKLANQNQNLIQSNKRLEQEKKGEEKQKLEIQKEFEKVKEVQEQITSLIQDFEQEYLIIRNQAPTWFRVIMGDRIKTKAYLTTALDRFGEKTTELSRIKNSLVFVSRYTFENSTEWFITTQRLSQKGIDYVELTGMDAREDLLQIFEYLISKKGEYAL